MPSKLDHNECREKVCVICIRKASRILSETEAEFIQNHLRENYKLNDPDFPCGLCAGCRIKLYAKMKDTSLTIPVESFIPDRSIQLRSAECQCLICVVATADFNQTKKQKKRKGRPTAINTPVQRVVKKCSICWSDIYPGCRHKCNLYYKNALNIKKPHNLPNASIRRKLHVSLDDM